MSPGVPPETEEEARVGCLLMGLIFLAAAFGGPLWVLLTGQANG